MQIACSAKLAVSVKIKGIVQTVPPTQHSHHNQSIKKQITSHSNPNFGIFILIPPLHAPGVGYLRLPLLKNAAVCHNEQSGFAARAATVRAFVLALSALHLTHSDTPPKIYFKSLF